LQSVYRFYCNVYQSINSRIDITQGDQHHDSNLQVLAW
jgi:hypothetical protein